MTIRTVVCCHGNICRSPLAGVVLAKLLGNDYVRSRGLVGPGRRAAKKVRDFAEGLGYDLAMHRSQVVTPSDLEWAEVIIYMDGGNRGRLLGMGAKESLLLCLGSAIGLERVADPAFVKKGPELDKLLALIVNAATATGKNLLAQKKTPR